MKHKFNKFVLYTAGVALLGGLLAYSTTILQDSLKRIVAAEIKKNINLPFSMRNFEGNLLTGISARDLVIYNDKATAHNVEALRADRINVTYDLRNLIFGGGPAKKQIDIELVNPKVNVEHYSDDTFNLVKMLRPQPKQKKQPFPYHLYIKAKGLEVSYYDHRGFGSLPLKEAVANRAKNIRLDADFDGRHFNVAAKGELLDLIGVKPFKLKGHFDNKKNEFALTLTAAGLDGPKWASYIIPLEGIVLLDGVGSVALGITNRKVPAKKNELPFDLKVWINAGKVMVRLPWIKPEIREAKGRIIVTNDYVRFEDVSATAAEAPFSMSGTLSDFAQLKTDISIKAKDFDNNHAQDFYPFFKKWKLVGKSDLDIAVKSQDGNIPVVSGKISVPSASVYGYPISDVAGTFEYRDSNLGLAISKGLFYDGAVTLTGNVDLSGKIPFIRASGNASGVNIKKLFRGSALFSGNADAVYSLKGIPDNLEILTHVEPRDVLFLYQPVKGADIATTYKNDVLDFHDVSINVQKDDVVKASGKLFADKTFSARIFLKDVYFDNSRHLSEKLGPISGKLSGSAESSGLWNDQFTSAPMHWSKTGGSFSIRDLCIHGQTFTGANGSVSIGDDKLYLKGLSVYGDDGRINADLLLDAAGLVSGTINSEDFNLNKYNLIKSNLPEKYQNISAKAAYTATISRKPGGSVNGESFLDFMSVYDISGQVNASQINYHGQPIKHLSLGYVWDGHSFTMDDIKMQEGYSTFQAAGYVAKDNTFSIKFQSPHVLLDDFMPLTGKYGSIGGNGSCTGVVYGTLPSWNISSHFDFAQLRYNSVILSNVKGNMLKAGNSFNIFPLTVAYKKNNYNLNGNFILGTPLKYNMSFDVSDVELNDLLQLVTMIKNEYLKKDIAPAEAASKVERINLSDLLQIGQGQPFNNAAVVYSNGSTKNMLADFNSIKEQALKSTREELGLQETFGGLLSGKLTVSNMTGALHVNAGIEVKKGHASSLTFETLTANIQTKANQIKIDLVLNKGQIADGEFDEISADMVLDDKNVLHINQLAMAALEQPSQTILNGVLPLGEFVGAKDDREIDLNLMLQKNNINLLALFNKNIMWIKNDGDVFIHVGGTMAKPLLNGSTLSLINSEMKLVDDLYIKSSLKVAKADIKLRDNVFYLNDLNILWEGKDTLKNKNQIIANGTISLRDLTLLKYDRIVVDFDLNFNKSKLKINFPELYQGEVALSGATFSGPMIIALSKEAKLEYETRIVQENEIGPLLKADVLMFNGDIPLPDNTRPKRKPSILFNIRVLIGKDVAISGGDFSKGAISSLVNNINFKIVETKTPLLIRGSLNTIIIDGSLNFDTGEVVFLNKGFQLMPLDIQAKYLTKDKNRQNSVDFAMIFDEEQNRRRIRPLFHLAALNEFEQTTVNITDPAKKSTDKYALVFLLEGSILDPMSMSMYLYNNNVQPTLMSGYPYIVGRLTYDQLQDLYKYMFPELLKPEFYSQIFSSGFQGAQTQQLIRGISEKQINSALAQQLRPIERDLADKIGLYDIKFDYNLGQTVNDAVLGKTQSQTDQLQTDSKVLGVDFAFKVFVDRLFVRIKTQLDQAQSSQNLRLNLSEYELTLAILEWLSLNYTNRLSMNVNDASNTSKGGFSLEALYNF